MYSLSDRIVPSLCARSSFFYFFFFNDTATTEIYTLSLHDALPILGGRIDEAAAAHPYSKAPPLHRINRREYHNEIHDLLDLEDRKSTRLNSSHSQISYAVFCLKKKKKNIQIIIF